MEHKTVDHTEYAKSIGYKGTDKVLVVDGKVVSHNNQDWLEFCDMIRYGSQAK